MPGPVLHGQVTLSGTAQQLDSGNSASTCKGFTIKAPITNAAAAFVGAAAVTSGTGHVMDPGDEITYERLTQNGQPFYDLRPADLYVVGSTGDKVSWLASP